METLINVLIGVVSAGFTYFFGKMSKAAGWDEELPVPVQSALIASIVFVLAVLLGYVLKLPVDVQSMAMQIFAAFSGSWGATWAYDTNKQIKKLKEINATKDAKGE